MKLPQSLAEGVKQIVPESEAEVVCPDVRHIEAEPRVRVQVEDEAKICSALARVFLDVHVLEHHPSAETSQRTLANEQVRVENSVEVPRRATSLSVTGATEV